MIITKAAVEGMREINRNACTECAERGICPKHCNGHQYVYEDGSGDVCRFCGTEMPDFDEDDES